MRSAMESMALKCSRQHLIKMFRYPKIPLQNSFFFVCNWCTFHIFFFFVAESASTTSKFKQAIINLFKYQRRTSNGEQQQQEWQPYRNSCVRVSCLFIFETAVCILPLKQLCDFYKWSSCLSFRTSQLCDWDHWNSCVHSWRLSSSRMRFMRLLKLQSGILLEIFVKLWRNLCWKFLSL